MPTPVVADAGEASVKAQYDRTSNRLRGDSMLDRRTFMGGVVGGLLAARLAAGAQQAGRVYRIAYLSAPTHESVEQVLRAFLRTLRELGWVEGQNLIIEYRWAEGKIERLPTLAAELVQLRVDVIVAPAGSAAPTS
jgi:ABC-type uncharacterized transport system substrate-binding protein